MEIEVILLIIATLILFSGFRIAKEYERGVVFRFGRYTDTRGPGLYWIIPLNIENAITVDLRTKTIAAEQQETIKRDSVTVRVNAVFWYQIINAEKAIITVTDANMAVYQLSLTSLRNIIGQHDLDEILQERNKINDLLLQSVYEPALLWGIKIQKFEMKDVELPAAMQEVMAMQAQAIREKRARLIKAEAEFEASKKLNDAAAQMASNPVAIELRRMQMVAEVGAENNSSTIIMIPSDFISMSKTISEYLTEHKKPPV